MAWPSSSRVTRIMAQRDRLADVGNERGVYEMQPLKSNPIRAFPSVR
jgi:hypothetical protein